jgi:hypothetical protein
MEAFWEKTRSADGFKSSSKDLPLPTWHEAFRYFRYSQLRDDLYAAYREAFLAVESLLSSYSPKSKGESETKWHLRTNRLLEANGLDFSQINGTTSTDPVAEFVSVQFNAHRCSHFHAKVGSDHFLPGVLSDRHLVTDSLEKLGRYITEASRIICGTQTLVGSLTFGGMKMSLESFTNDLILAVSPDSQPVLAEDTQISPNGFPVTKLQTIYEGIIDGLGYEFGFLGKIDVKELESPFIAKIVSFVPKALLYGGNIPILDLSGADKFEFRLIFYYSSNSGLKGGFAL